MMKQRAQAAVFTAAMFGGITWSGAINASGFSVPEMSTAGLALSNAMVANTREVGAIPYNPAVMAFLKDGSAGAGTLLISSFLRTADVVPLPQSPSTLTCA